MLAFDIAQFFPSLNHWLLSTILEKASFNLKVTNFFSNYLIDRKTSYIWNNFSSCLFDINMGVGQGLALSPILSALYLSPFLHILEKWLKILNLKISILSFVNDSLLILQSKSLHLSNTFLFSSYNVASLLLSKFGLIIKHSKTEVFHFSRSYSYFNSPPLDLIPISRLSLVPKNTWQYLGFIFDRKLSFWQHIDFYANKAILTVKCMKILSNLSRGLNLLQKQLLYRSCTLSIALYGFQLWFYHKAPLSYPLKTLGKLQRKVVIWILGVFKTSPSYDIEVIIGLIPIYLYLQKLSGRSQLRAHSLSSNYILRLLMNNISNIPNFTSHSHLYLLLLNSLTKWQCGLIKGPIIDIDNRFNKVFHLFDPLNPEFCPGNRVIDNFSNCFSFHLFAKSKDCSSKLHIQQLDALVINSSSSVTNALIIMDASIRNNVALSITHIHVHDKPVVKTLYHTINVTSTEA